MDKLDFPGVVLPRTPEVLALYSQQPLTVLSSAEAARLGLRCRGYCPLMGAGLGSPSMV